MNTQEKSQDINMVSCEICLKEIPQSEAKVSEARDYVMYFCGLECFQQWQHKHTDNQKE